MTEKRALIVGAGISGLVVAKELLDVGFDLLLILERALDLGGVWQTYCWKSVTLTSSKWMTEFGSYPMPESYPHFITPQQMMDYLRSFVREFNLEQYIRYGRTVRAIERNVQGNYDILTNQGVETNWDFVVLCAGLHGQPNVPHFPGLDTFQGTIFHSSEYQRPDPFQGRRVLCLGLGESSVGISAEISTVASRTVVSASSFAPAPRVQPYTDLPFDQLQFWPIGQYMKDYQETLTWGASWYNRLPEPLRSLYQRAHPGLRHFPPEWLPPAWIPYNWLRKYWPKPNATFGEVSGNLTRPENATDDILYLIGEGRIVPKTTVANFDRTHVHFADGTREEIDVVLMNVGYKPSVFSIQFPNNWQYRHHNLYKGCLDPELPNVAFVGLVRPTTGSIPAMAEMQARFVAGVFSGNIQLPPGDRLQQIVQKQADRHARDYPTLQARFPHIYFFDRWMEEMADAIGCRPQPWQHLGSWRQFQAYWFGAPLPLRFRLRGPGAVEGGTDRYADRVNQLYGKRPGSDLRLFLILTLLYPHLLTLLLAIVLFWGLSCSAIASLTVAALFWVLYMTVDLFRFIASMPLILIRQQRLELVLAEDTTEQKIKSVFGGEIPNYQVNHCSEEVMDDESTDRRSATASLSRPYPTSRI